MSVGESNNEFNILVARYLSREFTPEEMLEFEGMLKKNPEKQKALDEYRKIWDSVGSVGEGDSYDLDVEWDLLHEKIPGFDRSHKSPSRTLFLITSRIAAILVVGLVFTFAWFYATRIAGTRQVVAGNEPVELILNDGTRVFINRDSKIRYEKSFSESDRTIKLEGEAWFDVTRDTTRPFIIDAGSAEVEVLGTSFNVNAYKENSKVEITVTSGVVVLTPKQDRQEQIVLKAGNGGSYNKMSKELNLVARADPNTISWKTRELFFENTSLNEVADLVSKVYNTSLVIANRDLALCPITVTFRDQSLDAVLNVLASTLDLEITRTSEGISLDGAGCNE